MTLLETLPLFLALSAAQNALQESTITDLWMRLAAGYMAQAFAAEVLVHGSDRHGLLEEVFRWGFDPDCDAEEGSDAWLINDMFDADYEVLSMWEEIKEQHMHAVIACSHEHLMMLANAGTTSSFNRQMGSR